jgi:hypothetical protein
MLSALGGQGGVIFEGELQGRLHRQNGGLHLQFGE